MRRGTTPTHTIEVDIDTKLIKEVKITYSQCDKVILEKKKADCTIENGVIITKLSQEETFLFDDKKSVSIQLRVLTNGDDAISSDIIIKSIYECLDDEVLK